MNFKISFKYKLEATTSVLGTEIYIVHDTPNTCFKSTNLFLISKMRKMNPTWLTLTVLYLLAFKKVNATKEILVILIFNLLSLNKQNVGMSNKTNNFIF